MIYKYSIIYCGKKITVLSLDLFRKMVDPINQNNQNM